jgi:hypothetical protein
MEPERPILTPYQEQEEFCERQGYPLFAFEICPSCHTKTFDHPSWKDRAGKSLCTGCPTCGRSWCD